MGDSAVRVVLVFPELLGTYGDGGNATVLAQRLRWRDIDAELLACPAGTALPESGDVYLLGGGEDAPQARAAAELLARDTLTRAVERGAAVFAVCGGYQILGRTYAGADGGDRPGLGLLDVHTTRRRGERAVGELVAECDDALAVPVLTGFENHGGGTELGSGTRPLARVRAGYGNGVGDGTEGAITGRVIGTYLHGPCLARNPQLADRILEWIVGPLAPLDDSDVVQLRAERLAAATTHRRRNARRRFTRRWFTKGWIAATFRAPPGTLARKRTE